MKNDIDLARKLFRDFHAREPRGNEIAAVEITDAQNVLAVGSLFGLIYKTKDERKPFIHRFNANNRPLLYVSADGRQVYILKGGYRFSARGFVG